MVKVYSYYLALGGQKMRGDAGVKVMSPASIFKRKMNQ
jgi:hypothetical protein